MRRIIITLISIIGLIAIVLHILSLKKIAPTEDYPYAKKKKSVLLAHASQHRNIKKFFPSYKYIPSKIYFRLFDKEYFNIIEL